MKLNGELAFMRKIDFHAILLCYTEKIIVSTKGPFPVPNGSKTV